MRVAFRGMASALAVAVLCLFLFGGPQRTEASRDFYSSLRLTRLSYEPFLTLDEFLEISDAVVVGRFENVAMGRVIGGKRGERGTAEMILVTVEVSDVVAGELPPEDETSLHLELPKPRLVSVAELREALPKRQDVLLVLQDLSKLPPLSEVDESGVERDRNKALYTVPTPKGLFVADNDHAAVVTPLDDAPGQFDSHLSARNIVELAEEIRQRFD